MSKIVTCPHCDTEFMLPARKNNRENVSVERNIRRIRNPNSLSERYSVRIDHWGERFLQEVDSLEMARAVKAEIDWKYQCGKLDWHKKLTQDELDVIKRTIK